MLSELKEVKLQIVGTKARGQVCFKKTNYVTYQGVRNVHFSENLTCFVFLKHPF